MNGPEIILFKHDDVVVELQNTLLSAIKYDLVLSLLPKYEHSEAGRNQRVMFALIASYTRQVVQGFDWQPPSARATEDEIFESFESFYSLGNAALVNAWGKAVDDMLAPIVDRRAANPTQERTATSSRRKKPSRSAAATTTRPPGS